MEKLRPKILVICDYYLPGYESGGSMRTLVNMIDRLGDDFDFRVVTRDHDGKLNRTPYTSVAINAWNTVRSAEVYYLSKERVTSASIRRLVAEVEPNAIYLNSFFSPLTLFTLVLRSLGRIPDVPIILAPEGELSEGALSIKKRKKAPYLKLLSLARLLNRITWKAASDEERRDIERTIGGQSNIMLAANMPPKWSPGGRDVTPKEPKPGGRAEMVFLSRFMRKKNFNWLLEHLHDIEGELQIDIYGTLEEPDYWQETERLIRMLPANIKVTSRGPVPNDQVPATLAGYHFFILPTLGENFGHVFIEALSAGIPLIISDRTPWRDLESKGIGWDISLDDPGEWARVINRCTAMAAGEYEPMSRAASEFAARWLSDPEHDRANREVLESVLAAHVK